MTRVTIDAALREKLMDFRVPLELCDESGHVVARVAPSTPYNDPENWVELTPHVSEEEIERRISSDEPTYTTQEVIEKIKKLHVQS
jgi:hypothetical protein